MDCNSIIYDAVHLLNKKDGIETMEKTVFENTLIDMVIVKIQNYIDIIKPTNTVFIAFDGVAPFAKMEQQRTRRYKSYYMSKTFPNQTNTWNTSAITPGTVFMENLANRVRHHFEHSEKKNRVKKIIVSCSDEVGEGEHKITAHIREHSHENQNIALYGLDADLIMLSMFHLKYCKNIYVFREAPEFIKNALPISVNSGTSVEELYFLDIELFTTTLLHEMHCDHNDRHRIYDYVFMCFLLGNDFLPHFPAMNIRTHGIAFLMDIYRMFIGNHTDRFFISKDTYKIQWKNVGIFIKEIAKREHELLTNEYFVRDKFDKRQLPDTTPEEKEEYLQNIPIICRAEEKYICPSEAGWEARYYKSLFHDVNNDNIKGLCNNYLEGLEWTFHYYLSGCMNWKWKYNYHYPPLFKDLLLYIPHFEMDFIKPTINDKAFSPELQLSYVLPASQLSLLPKNIHHFLTTNYSELYPEEYKFQWAFCRYFWEAHPLLPEVPVELLEQWDIQFRLNKKV